MNIETNGAVSENQPAMNSDTFTQLARPYIERGWPVLPVHSIVQGQCDCHSSSCSSPGKHPRLKAGLREASRDFQVVGKWGQTWPTANVAVLTGPEAGLMVLDVDVAKGGNDSLQELVSKYGDLPPTVQVNTGSGGTHYYFKYPAGGMKNKAGFRPGLDVRGDGGYVVAPPSTHVSGGKYSWAVGCAPHEIELAPAPVWLLEEMEAKSKTLGPQSVIHSATAPARGIVRNSLYQVGTRYIANVPCSVEGSRNNGAFQLAGHLAAITSEETGEVLDEIDILDLVQEWNSRSPTPLGREEIQRSVRSAMTNGTPRTPKIVDTEPSVSKQESGRQKERLMALLSGLRFFKAEDDQSVCYVDVLKDGHRATMDVHSVLFEAWVRAEYFRVHSDALPSSALKDGIETFWSQAMCAKSTHPVALRVGHHERKVYIDLCDSTGRCVCIDAAGWRVIESVDCPVHFVRTSGMRPLPEPRSGGSLELFRRLINAGNEDTWILIVAWLTSCFMPQGAYPILAINGEHGSCKSTATRLLRDLIDPGKAGLRAEPHGDRDLMIAAKNSFVLSFDNLSHLQPSLSDGLCRLATGGGFSTRELYTNSDEMLIEAKRPVMLNGIQELTSAADLADRTLLISLPKLVGPRRTDEEISNEFREAQPLILGALYDAVSIALKRCESVEIKDLPRMADFARWATAAEPGLGIEDGSFMAAYMSNREEADDVVLESAPIGAAFLKFMASRSEWKGRASDLLSALSGLVSDDERNARSWPKTGRGMGDALTRLTPTLRRRGYTVTKTRSTDRSRTRLIEIRNENEIVVAAPSLKLGHFQR